MCCVVSCDWLSRGGQAQMLELGAAITAILLRTTSTTKTSNLLLYMYIYVYMYINTSYTIYICANTQIPHIQLQFAALIKQKPTTVVAITTDIWMDDRERIENQINNTHKLSHAVCMYIYEYSVYI